MPANTIYVGRPTKWGNRFRLKINYKNQGYARAFAINRFSQDLINLRAFCPEMYEELIAPLRGKNLACWCPLDRACHADVLLRLANPGIEVGPKVIDLRR